ncbi:hypothetical protein D5F53_12765 [Paenibacillus lautus]|uniref:Uncharacterized protein n=1 Tax=Paenibacillus lautus TaxID=1401 RepID=A0A385TN68_PAELA|nr:hypothetical protein D5F53_12765 [Paenibacillus lautus]
MQTKPIGAEGTMQPAHLESSPNCSYVNNLGLKVGQGYFFVYDNQTKKVKFGFVSNCLSIIM